MYKYYLDNILVTEPIGGDNNTLFIEWVRDLKGLLERQENPLQFSGDGYDYLRQVYEADRLTGEVDVRIQKSTDNSTFYDYYNGKILMRDVEWDHKRKIAKTPVLDASFYAKINNNKNIKVNPASPTSKLGVDISSSDYDPIVIWMTLNTPGTYAGDDNLADQAFYGYYVHNVIQYAIEYITDGEVGYESSVTDTGGTFEKLAMTYGLEVRRAYYSTINAYSGGSTPDLYFNKDWVGVSFMELITNMSKLGNYRFIIDSSGSRPVVRFEAESYFKSTDVLAIFENVDSHDEQVEQSLVYSAVALGDQTDVSAEQTWGYFPMRLKVVGFAREEYPMEVSSNSDNKLNLVSDWILHHMAWHDMIYNKQTSDDKTYDEYILLAVLGSANGTVNGYTAYDIALSNWIEGTGIGYQYQNELLTNASILNRWFDGIPSNVLLQIDLGTDGRFFANRTADYLIVTNPVLGTTDLTLQFNNDSTLPAFDTASRYNTGTYRYTVPSGQDGVYAFSLLTMLFIEGNGNYLDYQISLYVDRYDVSNSLINSYLAATGPHIVDPTGQNSIYHTHGSVSVYCLGTEYLKPRISINNINSGNFDITLLSNIGFGISSHFECTANSFYSGELTQANKIGFPVYKHKFEYPIDKDTLEKIRSNPRGVIKFNRFNQPSVIARIDKMQVDMKTGLAKFQLLSNESNN
jgi:hypothetical protein